MGAVELPNRSLFRTMEVCQIAEVQPYVLRSWEAEFPDLGVSNGAGAARVYRRSDVERVLRLKHLLFVEGLTLAGARRRLAEEQSEGGDGGTPLAELLGQDAGERVARVRDELRAILAMLSVPEGNEPPVGAARRPGAARDRGAERPGAAAVLAGRPRSRAGSRKKR